MHACRVDQLQAEAAASGAELGAARWEAAASRVDALRLCEKIRYLQRYAAKDKGRGMEQGGSFQVLQVDADGIDAGAQVRVGLELTGLMIQTHLLGGPVSSETPWDVESACVCLYWAPPALQLYALPAVASRCCRSTRTASTPAPR